MPSKALQVNEPSVSSQAHKNQTEACSTDTPLLPQKKVHFVLQGKGGIGKSFVSTLIAQYIKQSDPAALCFDTDPVNTTFSSFLALEVQALALLDADNTIDESRFDRLIEQILTHDNHVVVDNGAASFIPLSTYLIDNEVFDLIHQSGKQIVIHSVIAGGLAQDNTVSDFMVLTQQLPEFVEVVVWLNEYLGPIEADGKQFEDMRAYQENKHRVSAIIHLPKRTEKTYGADMNQMMKLRMTFDEALQSSLFPLMAKQRLTIMRRDVFQQLEVAL